MFVMIQIKIILNINLKELKQRNDILKDSPIFDFVNRDNIEKLMNKEAMPNSESKLLFNFTCLFSINFLRNDLV